MSDDNNRLNVAQWVLERNLAWISAAEVKVGVIVVIDTAMFAGLGAALIAADAAARTNCAYLLIGGTTAALASSIICAAMAMLPRLNGPANSLVYFGRIGELDEADYVERFKKATNEQLLEDWSSQIHINAQIACKKFRWTHTSIVWAFWSMVPWFLAIFVLTKK